MHAACGNQEFGQENEKYNYQSTTSTIYPEVIGINMMFLRLQADCMTFLPFFSFLGGNLVNDDDLST